MYARSGSLPRLFRQPLYPPCFRSVILLLWTSLLLSCVLVQAYTQEDITLSAGVNRTEVPQDQHLLFTITVRWVGSIGYYDFEWPAPPDCIDLAVVGHAASNQVSSDQGQRVAIKTFSYTLQPLATGRATIGATEITYIRKSDASSQPRRLTTRPIMVTVVAPTSDAEHRLTRYIAIVIAAAAALSLILFLRHKRTPTPIEEAPSIRSIEDQALEDLDKASDLRLAGEMATYYVEIAQVLTTYMERKWSIQCVGVATTDIIQRMRQKGPLPDSIIEETQAILSECDLVKFAGHDPTPSEQDHIHDQATAFIRHCATLTEQGESPP